MLTEHDHNELVQDMVAGDMTLIIALVRKGLLTSAEIEEARADAERYAREAVAEIEAEKRQNT